jgi:hypothetical protein
VLLKLNHNGLADGAFVSQLRDHRPRTAPAALQRPLATRQNPDATVFDEFQLRVVDHHDLHSYFPPSLDLALTFIGTNFSLQVHFNCRSFTYITLGQNQKCTLEFFMTPAPRWI